MPKEAYWHEHTSELERSAQTSGRPMSTRLFCLNWSLLSLLNRFLLSLLNRSLFPLLNRSLLSLRNRSLLTLLTLVCTSEHMAALLNALWSKVRV